MNFFSKTIVSLSLATVLFTSGMTPAQAAQPLGSTISYQGRLENAGLLVNDISDFEFTLFDEETNGNQIGPIVSQPNVDVIDGSFSVELDFGPGAFDNTRRWLQISVRSPAGVGSFSDLDPRLPIHPAPTALFALSSLSSWLSMSDIPAGFADDVDDDTQYDAGSALQLDGTTFHIAANAVTAAHMAANSIDTTKIADGMVLNVDLADASVDTDKIADGSVTTIDLADAAINNAKLALDSVTSDKIQDLSVATSDLSDLCVTTVKLALNSVTTDKIADASVTSVKIAPGAIDASHIPADAIDASKIADGTVGSLELADSSVTASKLAADSVSSSSIVDGSVGNLDLADGSVTNGKLSLDAVNSLSILDGDVSAADLALDSVNTASIVDAAVTSAKIAPGAIDASHIPADAIDASKIADGSVGSLELADGSVLNSKLAASAVNSANIADGAVGNLDLADGSITNNKLSLDSVNSLNILDGAVSAADLSLDSVNTASLVDAAVTSAKIAPGAIDASHIPSDSIDASKIADGSIGALELADGAVSNAKLALDAVGSANIADGSISAADLANSAVSSSKLATDSASLAQVSGNVMAVDVDKVGIGTSTPAEALSVNGTVQSLLGGFRFPDDSVQDSAFTGVLDWTDLLNIPADFADGVDDNTVGTVGAGLALNGSEITIANDGISSAMMLADEASLSKVTGGAMTSNAGNVGVGTSTPTEALSVNGTVQSLAGGFKFPDASTQTTAFTGALDWSSLINIPADFADGVDDNTVGTVGAGLALSGSEVSIANNAVSSAMMLADEASLNKVTDGAMSASGGNVILNGWIGTDTSSPFEVFVDNERAIRIERTIAGPNITSGNAANSILSGVRSAVICGGGTLPFPNIVTDDFGTISGGRNNQAGDNAGTVSDKQLATVGGGFDNVASGLAATVGGGGLNTASAPGSTIAGGNSNEASGLVSTVSGGEQNVASGFSSTVPGGSGNIAAGDYSFAAGRNAKAASTGTCVLADSNASTLTSTAPNQFTARYSGGVRFFTNSGATVGAELTAGSGSWASMSDRNFKENFAELDAKQVLDRVVKLPILNWNYTSQDDSIRHIGPMAQDFYKAFGVGEDERHITVVDADGVALAAIQGLHEIVKEKDHRIDKLEIELAELKALVHTITSTQDGGVR